MNASVWTFELDLVSPLAMGGASPNKHGPQLGRGSELRVASIRGALRSWHRVLSGPGPPAIERELALFGGVGRGQGQGLVSLGLATPPIRGNERWEARGQSGLSYLGYSLTLGENQRRVVFPGEGMRFALNVVVLRQATESELSWLGASLWALFHLGSVGSRARRGFGSVGIGAWPEQGRTLGGEPAIAFSPGWPHVTNADTFDEARDKLSQGRRLFEALPGYVQLPEPAVCPPHYYWSAGCRVVLWLGRSGRGWASWKEALDEMGRAMSEYRRKPGIDFAGSAGARAEGKRGFARRRAAFGLPIEYRFRRERFQLLPFIESDDKRLAGMHSRMPSPFWIRLVRCGGRYGVVLTRLSGPLPGVHIPVVRSDQGRGFDRPNPDNRILDEFLDELPGTKHEVGA